MNQILSTNNQFNDKKGKEKEYSSNTNSTSNNKNVIIIFSVIILIFGLAAAGFGIYKYFSKNGNLKGKEPVVSMQQMETGISINVSSELGIQMVKYNWNDESSIETNVNNSSVYSTIVNPIGGQNTLNVIVIDSEGKEHFYADTFSFEDTKPTIEYNIAEDETGNKIIKISATDDTAIDHISYKWNEEEENEVKAEEGEKEIETSIQIKRGENKLTIIAVDTLGNEAKKENLPIIGVKKPEVIVKQTGNIITMTITHDLGFKKIDFILNGVNFTYDENSAGYDSTLSKIEYTYDLQEGENNIVINAYSMEDTEFKYTGICQYQQ